MILGPDASTIMNRLLVYGLLRRRSVTKWLMIVLVPNSSIIIRISELIVQNFAFIFKPLKNYFLITFCFFFILDANYASTSPTSLFKVELSPKSSSVTLVSIRALDVFVRIESQIVDMDSSSL